MRVIRGWQAFRSLSVMTFALLTLVTPAQAQFGVLKRAAERRVGEKANDRMGENSLVDPTFDATTIPITAERLDRYSAALVKVTESTKLARAAAAELMLHAQLIRDSAQKAAPEKEYEANKRSVDRYNECRNDVGTEIAMAFQQQTMATVAQAQANPAAYQKDPKTKAMVDLMKEVSAAQARGDTAAYQAGMRKMMGMMGAVADSADMDSKAAPKCGQRPGPTPGMLRAAAMSDRATAIEKQAGGVVSAAMKVKGADVGMTDVQSAMYCERVASWLAGMRNDAPITRTFTKDEYQLLVSRRSDLRKLKWGEC